MATRVPAAVTMSGFPENAGFAGGAVPQDVKDKQARDMNPNALPKSSGFRSTRGSSNIKGQQMQGGVQRLNMSEFGGFGSQDMGVGAVGGPMSPQANSQSWLSQHGNKLYRQSDKNAYGQPRTQKSNYPLSNMDKKPSKTNNSMLHALPAGSQPLVGDQSDIVARRHKISGSGGLQGSNVQKSLPPQSLYQSEALQNQHGSGQGNVFHAKMGNILYQKRNSRASKSRQQSNKTPRILSDQRGPGG